MAEADKKGTFMKVTMNVILCGESAQVQKVINIVASLMKRSRDIEKVVPV